MDKFKRGGVLLFKIKKMEKGLNYYCYVNEKFKFNTITINLIVELDEKNAAQNAVLASVLRQSSNKYKTNIELGNKLRSLYGADFFCDVKKAGNRQIIVFGIEILDDDFALEKEELLKEAVNLLFEAIFDPKLEDKKFTKEAVEIEKKDIIESVKSTYSDKKQYAFKQAIKTLFEGDVFAIDKFSSLKMLEEVEEKGLYESYIKLLKEAEVLVSFVGRREKLVCLEEIFKVFSNFKRDGFKGIEKKEQFVFKEFKEKQEIDNLTQAKLVIALSKKEKKEINVDDEAAIEMMHYLFGGTATSLLFTNVREKESLCYYCRSIYNEYYGVIFVESGVEIKNVEKAYNAILAEFEKLKKGEFNEEDIDKVKSNVEGAYRFIFDNEDKVHSYVLNCFLTDVYLLPEEKFKKLQNITKDDIIRVANKFTVSLKYVLKGVEEK